MNGLQNLGNTCCINTLVQCIKHTQSLVSSLKESTPSVEGKGGTMTSQLLDVIDKLQHSTVVPQGLVSTIFDRFKCHITPGEQLDIVELWMLISEHIAKEVGAASDVSNVSSDADSEILKLDKQVREVQAMYNGKKTSPWADSYQGTQISVMQCECGFAQGNIEVFGCISLDIPVQNEPVTLTSLLNAYVSIERMDEWRCDRCGNRNTAFKENKLWNTHRVIVVTLKRFRMLQNGVYEKINTPVELDATLNVTSQMRSAKYKLTAMGIHVGGHNSGHYIAQCKTQDNTWIMIDDDTIHTIGKTFTYPKNGVYYAIYEDAINSSNA